MSSLFSRSLSNLSVRSERKISLLFLNLQRLFLKNLYLTRYPISRSSVINVLVRTHQFRVSMKMEVSISYLCWLVWSSRLTLSTYLFIFFNLKWRVLNLMIIEAIFSYIFTINIEVAYIRSEYKFNLLLTEIYYWWKLVESYFYFWIREYTFKEPLPSALSSLVFTHYIYFSTDSSITLAYRCREVKSHQFCTYAVPYERRVPAIEVFQIEPEHRAAWN